MAIIRCGSMDITAKVKSDQDISRLVKIEAERIAKELGGKLSGLPGRYTLTVCHDGGTQDIYIHHMPEQVKRQKETETRHEIFVMAAIEAAQGIRIPAKLKSLGYEQTPSLHGK